MSEFSEPPQIPVYSVRNWDALYENKDSRKLKNCRYVCVPNKHDGSSYGRMMAHPRKVELFAAWNAILQVASKMPIRGILDKAEYLPDAGKKSRQPVTPEDIAYRTRLPVEIFILAFSFFSSEEIGWLDSDMAISSENRPYREILPESPGTPGNTGLEGKGIEGNRREENKSVFDSPNLEEDEMRKKKEPVIQESLLVDPLFQDPEFTDAWKGFLEMRLAKKNPMTDYAQRLMLRKISTPEFSGGDPSLATAILGQSIIPGWLDIYPLKAQRPSAPVSGGHSLNDVMIIGEDA